MANDNAVDFVSFSEKRRVRHQLDALSSVRLLELELDWSARIPDDPKLALVREILASRGVPAMR